MSPDTVLHIKGLEFSYGAESFRLVLPEWRLTRGDSVFVHGASGSGKSTLLGLISGIHRAKAETFLLLQKDFQKFSAGQRDQFRADHLGIIFQQFNLIPYLTVVENILLPYRVSSHRRSKLSTSEIDEARRLLKALDILNLENQNVLALSVGQQQRVAAARALLGKPEFLIADEPTSALDTSQKDRFIQLLTEQAKDSKATLVFVSHDRGLEKHFDQSIALSDLLRRGHS